MTFLFFRTFFASVVISFVWIRHNCKSSLCSIQTTTQRVSNTQCDSSCRVMLVQLDQRFLTKVPASPGSGGAKNRDKNFINNFN